MGWVGKREEEESMKRLVAVLLVLFALSGCALSRWAEAQEQTRTKAAREATERRWTARAANVEQRQAATLARLEAERVADEKARELPVQPAPVTSGRPTTALKLDAAQAGAEKAREPEVRPAPAAISQPAINLSDKALADDHPQAAMDPEPDVEANDATFVRAHGAESWEPAGFRGVPWGASRSAVKRRLPGAYDVADFCHAEIKIGQVPVSASILFGADDGMDYANLTFSSDSFDDIRVAFIARYGEPTIRQSRTVQNRMGAKFENEILSWYGKMVVIVLQKCPSKLTESLAGIGTVKGVFAHGNRREEELKKGKKDL